MHCWRSRVRWVCFGVAFFFGRVISESKKKTLQCTQPCKKERNQLFGLVEKVHLLYFFQLNFHCECTRFTRMYSVIFNLNWWKSKEDISHVHIALLNKLCLWSLIQGTCVLMRSEANYIPWWSLRKSWSWLADVSSLFCATRSPGNSFEA